MFQGSKYEPADHEHDFAKFGWLFVDDGHQCLIVRVTRDGSVLKLAAPCLNGQHNGHQFQEHNFLVTPLFRPSTVEPVTVQEGTKTLATWGISDQMSRFRFEEHFIAENGCNIVGPQEV